MQRMSRNDIQRASAFLDIPLGDPFRYGERRDFVGDFFGGAVEAAGDVVGGAVDLVVSNPLVSTIAASVFPPIAPFVAGMNVVQGISSGNLLQAVGGAMGISGGAIGGLFDVPIDSATAMDAFTNLPLEAQNAYFNAGYSPLDVGTAISQDLAYANAFQTLPIDAQQAYLNAGYQPTQIGSSMLTDQARNSQLWGQLPGDAQQAYLSAGYTPDEIGGYLASDATIGAGSGALGGVKTAFDAMKAVNSLSGGATSGTSGLLSGLGIGANALGSYLANTAGQDAATKAAAAQIQASQIAAEAAKFKPIGITTRFGGSKFGKDALGNVTSAGYMLSPELLAQQNALMDVSNQALAQYRFAPGMFAPMGAAGQRAMSLGNQYLATDPQAQAIKYMQDQQALLATGRERDMNQMLTGEFNRGTYGLATGGASTGMGAANPRLEAMLNAQRQQDLGLAAQATQGGMDYAKFGAALTGTGGDLVKSMLSGQTAAYDPYKTAIGGAQYLEGLGQQPLTMGIDIGKQTSNAASGGLLAQGITNAAQIQQQAAGSPWANALGMLGGGLQNYSQQQQQQQQQQQMMNKIWGV